MLTNQQTAIMRLIWQGYSNEAIMQELSIARSTLYVHRKCIIKRLGAKSITHALIKWLRSGYGNLQEIEQWKITGQQHHPS